LTTSAFGKFTYGLYEEKAEVSYTVEGSTCNLELIGTVEKNGRVYILSLILHDSTFLDGEKLWLHVFKSETGFRTLEYKCNGSSIAWTKTKKKVDAWGGVTETKLYLYGTANRCGLLVWEGKNNDGHEEAKAVTIAHYFVHSSGTVAVNRCESSDIGFSVVVKIAESDGKFDITVEGPERHPVSALLYMFNDLEAKHVPSLW